MNVLLPFDEPPCYIQPTTVQFEFSWILAESIQYTYCTVRAHVAFTRRVIGGRREPFLFKSPL